MKLVIPALLLLLTSTGFSQNFSIRDIKVKPSYSKTPTIFYPIVTLENKTVEKAINVLLRETLPLALDSNANIKEVLSNSTKDNSLTDLTYEVTFKNQGILSFKFFIQGCGAYCSSADIGINIDLKTGNRITIHDLVKEDSLDAFQQIVFAAKLKALDHYKQEELKIDTAQGIDSTTYEWALGTVNDYCIKEVRIDNFYLMQDKLEFLDPCEFPHAIRALGPSYKLVFDYRSIPAYLKPDLFKLLIQH